MTDLPKPNAQHSMKSAEWYTPESITSTMRALFADEYILDPASCELANAIVQANEYFTAEDDGLTKAWCQVDPVSVFLNPPGGKLKNVSLPRLFWEKLMQEIADGHVNHAVYVAYSLEQLQQLQGAGMEKAIICVPPRRTRYLQVQEDGILKPISSPTHASAIVYVPGLIDKSPQFCHLFSSLGGIYQPLLVKPE